MGDQPQQSYNSLHQLHQQHSTTSTSGSSTSSLSHGVSTGVSRGSMSSQGGRRPIIIRDDQQRVMLQNIRDSLAHLQKHSPHSPGSDHSGASGTSTPSKEGAQSKDSQSVAAAAAAAAAKRSDTYNTAAMAKIRKSLQTFKKDEPAKDMELEATAKVNVRDLIDQICPPENRNGELRSKFGGLVRSPGSTHSTSIRKVSKPKTAVLATSQIDNVGGAVSPPPPLPPRTRPLATPPPPLPPRESHSTIDSGVSVSSSMGTAHYGPTTSSSASSVIPSATPASEMDQLAAQTGLTPQQIRDIVLKQHNASLQQQQQRQPQQLYSEQIIANTYVVDQPPPSLQPRHQHPQHNNTHTVHTAGQLHSLHPDHTDYHAQTNGVGAGTPYHPPPPHYHSTHNYNPSPLSSSSTTGPPPPPPYSSAHQASPASSVTSGSSSTDYLLHGYSTVPTGTSPATAAAGYISSVQSAVSDYRISAAGEHRPASTEAYSLESPSSGSSSATSLQNLPGYGYGAGGYGNTQYLHPPLHNSSANHATAAASLCTPPTAADHNKHLLVPKPAKSWQAKQAIVAQSAHSQKVKRQPVVHQLTAPVQAQYQPQAPPSYTTSIQAHVVGGSTRSNAASVTVPHREAPGQGRGGGNVHIKLRPQQDPQLQVNGYPSFHVTAHNSQPLSQSAHSHHHYNMGQSRGVNEQQRPSIQLHFSTGAGTIAVEPPHLRRRGSLETRSDSPVSRTTNQSPLSMISTTSTNSDCLVPERPPPPYPGSRQHAPSTHPHPHATHYPNNYYNNGATSSAYNAFTNDLLSTSENSPEPSEPEQSETESESGRSARTLRCTSPKPQLRPDGEKKDDDKLKHYSPAAFKFYMEQHIENVLKQHRERVNRRIQLEKEMSKVDLSDDTKDQMRKMLKQKETNYLRLKRAKMNRSMFEVITKLGIGAFGEVSLVRKKVVEKGEPLGEQLYAMKTLRKVDVIRRNQVAHVKAERDILAEAELEWVTKLYYSFQDSHNLYFIMEYIPGGDLMALLIKKGIFEEPLAMFYIAELVLAIESVHKMGFIHRDIKPDNVLIDKDGHLKLTDFGLCTGFRWTHNSKYYQEGGHNRQDSMDPQDMSADPCHCPKELPKILEKRRRREKQRCLAHSLVGTPNYIAPEVLLRSGYTKSCDWWSVGVILYEMLVGQPPFLANTPKETQYKVVHYRTTLHIPMESGLSLASQDLILNLCTGPDTRIGRDGADQIKRHAFFKPINFSDLRKQRAPYVPLIKYPTDTSNFDEVEEQHLPHYNPDDLRQNGHYPEHAFSEFTFRRFFDDGGHARPLNMAESLSYHINSLAIAGNTNFNNGGSGTHSNPGGCQSGEKTPQNSYHEEDVRPSSGGGANNPVYV